MDYSRIQEYTRLHFTMFYSGQGGLERCLFLDFWQSLQLLQNNFFYPNTPSMRKVNDGGEKGEKIMLEIVATNLVAS